MGSAVKLANAALRRNCLSFGNILNCGSLLHHLDLNLKVYEMFTRIDATLHACTQFIPSSAQICRVWLSFCAMQKIGRQKQVSKVLILAMAGLYVTSRSLIIME